MTRLFLKTFALIFVVVAIPLFALSRKIPAEDRSIVPLLEWRDGYGQPVFRFELPWDTDYETMRLYIQQVRELEALDLFFHELDDVPPEIGRMTRLSNLQLSRNNLLELPPEISHLFSLRRLYLGDNNLSELPPEIGQLTNLQQLHLQKNNLSELPPEIGQLSSLQRLYLDDNNLTSLPKELGDLSNLIALDVSDNPLPPEYPTETEALLEYLRNQ